MLKLSPKLRGDGFLEKATAHKIFKDDKLAKEYWGKAVFPGKGNKICKSTEVKN